MEPERRPYAATANVLAVLDRARSRNLPEVLDNDFLRLTGMPPVVVGRVTEALQFLDLIWPDGRPSDKLQAMAGAPENEYRALFRDCIAAAYTADFERVDPEKDSQGTIVEAFRRYEPRSQTNRMVMLFLGLCRAAGLGVLDAPRERKMHPKGALNRARPKNSGAPIRQRSETGGASNNGGRSGHAFTLTDEDIAVLTPDEFNDVWEALGKVARARALAKHPSPTAEESADDA